MTSRVYHGYQQDWSQLRSALPILPSTQRPDFQLILKRLLSKPACLRGSARTPLGPYSAPQTPNWKRLVLTTLLKNRSRATAVNINVEACDGLLKGVLEAFLLPTNWSFSVAELTIICFGRGSSGFRVTCPSHLTWAFCNRVCILGMIARVRTSVSGTMSCHLMLQIPRKHFEWKWLSFQAWRLYTVHDSRAYIRTVSTTAMYTFSLVSWLIPRLSHTFFMSLPNAELALESLLLTSTSMLASQERVLPR